MNRTATSPTLRVIRLAPRGDGGVSAEEIKKVVDDLQGAWTKFQAANDERLKQIEAKGTVDPLLQDKVTKANEDITRLSGEMKAFGAQIARLPNPGGAHGTGWTKGDPTPEQEAHAKAYKSWMRRGIDDGLNDAQAAAYKSMSVGDDPSGGYLVPTDTTGRIVQHLFETSDIRPYATIETISSDALEGPLDLQEASAGWVAETAARTETNTPKVGVWRIPVHEMYAEPAITQKLLDDNAYDVERWLSNKIADKLSRVENAAFVNGTGTGQPRGFMTAPVATTEDNVRSWGTVQYVGTGVAGAFANSDVLITTIGKMKQAYRKGAMWGMTRLTVAAIRVLKDGQGRYLWAPGLVPGQPDSLLSYPLAEFQDMAEIAANSYSIAFANFKEAYTIVDRIGIRTLRDPYTNKPFIRFYTTKRVGGDLLNSDAIKLIKFA